MWFSEKQYRDVNTLGNIMPDTRYLSVSDRPYESGHLQLEGEIFKVSTEI